MLNDSSGTQYDIASTALCRLGIHRSDSETLDLTIMIMYNTIKQKRNHRK